MADLPKGITREEKFLYAGATGDTSEMPEAITREEKYLKAIAENSGSTPNDGTLTIQKNGTTVGTFSANQATNETINIVVPVSAGDVSALPDTTKYGASLLLEINSSTFVVTATLKDQNGDALGTAQTIDLPLESVVVSGSYDDQTKKVILTLQSGSTIEFSVADLVSGLQSEITSANKLSADLVDDTNTTHKFATAAELQQIETNKTNISLLSEQVGYAITTLEGAL